jgi:hypothetical protein
MDRESIHKGEAAYGHHNRVHSENLAAFDARRQHLPPEIKTVAAVRYLPQVLYTQ